MKGLLTPEELGRIVDYDPRRLFICTNYIPSRQKVKDIVSSEPVTLVVLDNELQCFVLIVSCLVFQLLIQYLENYNSALDV